MQGMTFTIHEGFGTLAANRVGYISLPFACTLIAVTSVGAAASDATLDLGTVADGDGIIDGAVMGKSKAGATQNFADFNGVLAAGKPYHFAAGDEIEYTIDYDGAGGTAITLGSMTLYFVEG